MYNLENLSAHQLAHAYNQLNINEWDSNLGNKPIGWDNIPEFSWDKNIKTRHSIVIPIMYDIEYKIGNKEILREWNVDRGKMTEKEFEDWYNNRHIDFVPILNIITKISEIELKNKLNID